MPLYSLCEACGNTGSIERSIFGPGGIHSIIKVLALSEGFVGYRHVPIRRWSEGNHLYKDDLQCTSVPSFHLSGLHFRILYTSSLYLCGLDIQTDHLPSSPVVLLILDTENTSTETRTVSKIFCQVVVFVAVRVSLPIDGHRM